MHEGTLRRLVFAPTAFSATLIGSTAFADPGSGDYYGHHGMMGWGGWFFGPLMMLVFFGLLVVAVVIVARLLGMDSSRPEKQQEDRAHTILRERFARGDITAEEYEASKKILGAKTS